MNNLPPDTAILDIIRPTLVAYTPLLKAQEPNIRSTPRSTHSYGSHPRQELDVYTPPSTTTSSSSSAEEAAAAARPAPVIVWFHGGGFVRGAKNLTDVPDDLVYANVGHFFASKGYVAVIPNYRLVGEHGAKFPSGGEDAEGVVRWIVQNYPGSKGQARDLFLVGNSAGGVHVSTFVFLSRFEKTLDEITRPDAAAAAAVRLRGVGFVATPFVFLDPPEYRQGVLKTYFGEDMNATCSLALLEKSSEEQWALLERGKVQFKVYTFEKDPEDEIVEPKEHFLKAWEKKRPGQKGLTVGYAKGHNHISHIMSLGTGIEEEEAWGLELLSWMNEARK